MLADWVRCQRTQMVNAVADLALLESPSTDPDSQLPVFNRISGMLENIGYRTRHVTGRHYGGCLFARPSKTNDQRQVLVGHTDTVWNHGTLDVMPLQVRDDSIHGPGVYDMKGGIIQLIFALRALKELGMTPEVTPVILLNSDEELGSPESTPTVRRIARLCNRALVLEPSHGSNGRIKTSRKGVGRFTVAIHGRSSHAGLAPTEGISAIVELSHVIQRLDRMNDHSRGISVNVGEVIGGTRPNVVAATATATIDVRVNTRADAARIEQEIRNLRPQNSEVVLEVTGEFCKQPMTPSAQCRALWDHATQAGKTLGLDLEECHVGGASDGNTTSCWTATIDGLGCVGDGAHARHEHLVIDHLVQRTSLLAMLLLAPPV